MAATGTEDEVSLYLSSRSDLQLYPENTSASFRVRLPDPIKIPESEKWTIALLDLDLPRCESSYKPSFITIHSTLCTSSVLGPARQPVLQRVYYQDIKSGRPFRFETPRYVPLNVAFLEVLDVSLYDEQGQRPTFKTGVLNCTLHLRKTGDKKGCTRLGYL